MNGMNVTASGQCTSLTDVERGKLLTIDLFRLWTEKPPTLVKQKVTPLRSVV